MPIAAVAPALIGAGGSLFGGAIASSAAGSAAQSQADAATRAAALQYQSSQDALNFQKGVYGNQQAELNPYLQAGYGGLANLQSLLGITPQGNTVQAGAAGTAASGANLSPAQLTSTLNQIHAPLPMRGNVGPGALVNQINAQRSNQALATLNGGISSPGAINGGKVPISGVGAQTSVPGSGTAPGSTSLASLVNPNLGGFGSLMQPYGEKFVAPTGATEQNDPGYQFRLQEGEKALQNSAAAKGTLLNGATAKDINAYGQDYASNEYGNVYNRALGEYQNRYNIFQNDQTNKYNRLASLAGIGQTSSQQLNAAGQSAAGNVGSILGNAANQMGNAYQTGAARQSGYQTGGANAWANTLGNLGNYASLYSLLKPQGGGSTQSGSTDPYTIYS